MSQSKINKKNLIKNNLISMISSMSKDKAYQFKKCH